MLKKITTRNQIFADTNGRNATSPEVVASGRMIPLARAKHVRQGLNA